MAVAGVCVLAARCELTLAFVFVLEYYLHEPNEEEAKRVKRMGVSEQERTQSSTMI